jgi:IclR family transcriptional regulator, acetate operon repressor
MSTVKQIQAVRNACTVLDAIAARQPVGVSELARLTGLDKSGVHRIAITLHAAGWVRAAPGTSTRWELSPTFVRLARHGGSASLVGIARNAMERLRDSTGETVLLAVLDGDRLIVRATVESRHPVRLTSHVGAELPVPGSAAARSIAAHLPPGDLARLRDVHGDLDDDAALTVVRRRGWSANDGEVDKSVRAVAAPLIAEDGYPVAALVVCGPTSRMSPAGMRRYGRLTAAVAADALSGGTPAHGTAAL